MMSLNETFSVKQKTNLNCKKKLLFVTFITCKVYVVYIPCLNEAFSVNIILNWIPIIKYFSRFLTLHVYLAIVIISFYVNINLSSNLIEKKTCLTSRHGDPNRALLYLNKACSGELEDELMYILRSQCHMKLGHYHSADQVIV